LSPQFVTWDFYFIPADKEETTCSTEIRNRFHAALHVFERQLNSFSDIRQHFGNRTRQVVAVVGDYPERARSGVADVAVLQILVARSRKPVGADQECAGCVMKNSGGVTGASSGRYNVRKSSRNRSRVARSVTRAS
jgi:hypothetical protein